MISRNVSVRFQAALISLKLYLSMIHIQTIQIQLRFSKSKAFILAIKYLIYWQEGRSNYWDTPLPKNIKIPKIYKYYVKVNKSTAIGDIL